MFQRLKLFFTFWDSRFEDLDRKTWKGVIYRDFSAGLITAMTAIPMAMGFAIAMGLRPEQGIIAGAVACLVGRTFGGSKYQVYGPTAAFIPIILALVSSYRSSYIAAHYATLGAPVPQVIDAAVLANAQAYAHGVLVLVSCISGVILMLLGLAGLGKLAQRIPPSIVVGFTVGIAITIALSNGGEMFGYSTEVKGALFTKLSAIWEHRGQFNPWALVLAVATFFMTRSLLRLSIYIPGPLIAIGVCTLLSATLLSGLGLILVETRYGEIPSNFFAFTPPVLPQMTPRVLLDIGYFVAAIVFVSGVESLLCSSMADRLANNRKTPFNPDKEFWGQGLVQIITPLLNGFPCTGALARTATSIKAGAVTPFAGYFKGILKLAMAFYMATYLGLVPMACIAGILLWVASNMVKPAEIKHIWGHSRFHAALMVYTAVMVPVTDFLTGVLSALILYALLARFFETPTTNVQEQESQDAVREPQFTSLDSAPQEAVGVGNK